MCSIYCSGSEQIINLSWCLIVCSAKLYLISSQMQANKLEKKKTKKTWSMFIHLSTMKLVQRVLFLGGPLQRKTAMENLSIDSCAVLLGTNKEADWTMLTIDVEIYWQLRRIITDATFNLRFAICLYPVITPGNVKEKKKISLTKPDPFKKWIELDEMSTMVCVGWPGWGGSDGELFCFFFFVFL